MNTRALKDALSPVAFLVAVTGIVAMALGLCEGCAADDRLVRVEQAATVAYYDQQLVECQRIASKVPEYDRYREYIRCEIEVSRYLCERSPELQLEWVRCKEVMR